ncbi:esterase-like activity of phytase-domain-containing protein [Xylaria cf. heliscus]|nr:esterase-like activity of phytase-domain-containing protein [Xylaria cf. heliscus]
MLSSFANSRGHGSLAKKMMTRILLAAALVAYASGAAIESRVAGVNSTTCNGNRYVYDELAGYGFVPSNAVDKFGDTLGGLGSSLHLDRSSWKKNCNGSYSGILWSLPDRGWNTEGTLNYNPRVHKFKILFTPQQQATISNPSSPNLEFQYLDTIKFSGPDGTPCTGLDGDAKGHLSYAGFPDLPVATYEGDGFGGNGPGGKRIPIDSEGLYVNDDGTFWVSDEYGPYVYLFDPQGKMLAAIRPPESIVPKRNGTDSFSADSPPRYINNGTGDDVAPADPNTGRDNNHGFEGLTVSADGKSLYVLLQAATVQEGGLNKQTQRYTRFLKYDVSNRLAPIYSGEWIVPLPLYVDPTAKPSKNPKAAAQSEILALENGQFFVLSRDSSAGNGQEVTESVYRQIDVFDISGATNIKAAGAYDCTEATCVVADADTGSLKGNITTAKYCSFLDFNVNAQLGRFKLHNGGTTDPGLLNEKWESIGMVPVNPKSPNGEFFVFSLSDNDFITQDGHMNGGKLPYADESGFNLDNQALVFKITIS